ncbi:UNVERIFIED_CONTAM: hypothetical protein Slati_3716800 [Sesamum latifolium]|uniref:Reverse transcriptase Ty1/copia-type domain-containing protein n=1 Tax=Sesamum latifolium TaxID=2727402 RepID=A0AAW2U692_9LAMI
MGLSDDLITRIKLYLDNLFTINDLSCDKYFLGLDIAHFMDGMTVTQHKYILDILTDTGMTAANAIFTPLPLDLKLLSKERAPLCEPDNFRPLIERIAWMGSGTHKQKR